MKRTLNSLLLLTFLFNVAQAPYAVAAEGPTSRFGRVGVFLKTQWQNPSCRKSIAWFGGAAAIFLLGVGYYNHYTPGNIVNVGTAERPIWRPELKNTVLVDETIGAIRFPRERHLRITDGQKRYGIVVFKEDKIRWLEGDKVIAETCVVDPIGRPYSAAPEHGILVTVHDTQRKIIGTIEERSDEISPGTHRVFFIVRDAQGREAGRTEPFEETDRSVRLGDKPWSIDFENDGPKMTRSGWLATRYQIAMEKKAEEVQDERVLGILAALKSYCELFRGKVKE